MLANLVEGTFGRLFRSEVRPMELAHRLVREMDAHRTVSVSRVYAPNEYAVWLSPEDRDLYAGVEGDLIDELCAYLLEHARREDLMLASPPRIAFHTDERLALGEFGIEAKLASAGEPAEQEAGSVEGRRGGDGVSAAPGEGSEEPDDWLAPLPSESASPRSEPPAPAAAKHGETLIYSSSNRLGGPVKEARERRASRAMLLLGDRRVLVPPPGAVLGRSRECDIVLDDVGVSRRHAEIRPAPEGWTLVDLGSTNGVRLNDRRLRGPQPLQLGDRIELGTTELVFEVR
jgi:FhaA, N-terminal domain/FHA domain